MTPHNTRLAALTAPAQYAAVELWRGTVARHNVVVCRRQAGGDSHAVQFDDERWRNYVPLRLPQTRCVEQRLPSGKVGVLVNQSHTYSDLILPIDADEKRLFDAVDGHRTTAEIVEHVPEGGRSDQRWERARTFFERLWWYDQVVFDASRSGQSSSGEPS